MTGLLPKVPVATARSMREMSIIAMRPAPKLRWPTSLLPICPTGSPTSGPRGADERVGEALGEAGEVGGAREADGVGVALGALAEAVEDDEHHGARATSVVEGHWGGDLLRWGGAGRGSYSSG
jgi:hypothetical protein